MLFTRLVHLLRYCHHSNSRLVTSSLTRHHSHTHSMELSKIVSALEEIAPTRLAEDWDNVGLLIEPRQPQLIGRVLLTNDLTEIVLKEAQSLGNVGLIISYHPPIFNSFKRVTQASAKERIILDCIQSNIAVYSPHTALDNMDGGINSWLISGLGTGEMTSLGSKVIKNHLKNEVIISGVDMTLLPVIMDLLFTGSLYNVVTTEDGEVKVTCSDHGLVNLLPKIDELSPSSVSVKTNAQVHVDPAGGKLLCYANPKPLSVMISLIKDHLDLSHVRLAIPPSTGDEDPLISTVAVCAGSGGSVLHGVSADLFLTGEMSHHEVLEANSRGTTVVLCEHTNTERGYLQTVYRDKIVDALQGVEVRYSQIDRDPFEIA